MSPPAVRDSASGRAESRGPGRGIHIRFGWAGYVKPGCTRLSRGHGLADGRPIRCGNATAGARPVAERVRGSGADCAALPG